MQPHNAMTLAALPEIYFQECCEHDDYIMCELTHIHICHHIEKRIMPVLNNMCIPEDWKRHIVKRNDKQHSNQW